MLSKWYEHSYHFSCKMDIISWLLHNILCICNPKIQIHPEMLKNRQVEIKIQYARLSYYKTWASMIMADEVCQKWIKLDLKECFLQNKINDSTFSNSMYRVGHVQWVWMPIRVCWKFRTSGNPTNPCGVLLLVLVFFQG